MAWRGAPWAFQAGIAVWLWLTVLFANAAEAVAEGQPRARAESLRRARGETRASCWPAPTTAPCGTGATRRNLRENDVVLVEAGTWFPPMAR